MGIDILTVDNIFQYGVPTIILILFLYWFMRPMVSQNKEALETVTQVLKQSLSNSEQRAKDEQRTFIQASQEGQKAFIDALSMVEERHKIAIETISHATSEKLDTIIERTDTIIETATFLMQQNERLSNDANTIIQALEMTKKQERFEKELIAIKEAVNVNNNKQNRKQPRL